MSRSFFVLLPLVMLMLSGCSLDGFLFNTESLNTYALPDNTIPDSLLEEVTFPSGDNTLYGYWVESSGSRPGLAILYCHGNKHNLDEYWDRVLLMHRLGTNLLIFDYRGFGRSEGTSSEEGIYRDADAALSFVHSRGFSSDSIVVIGYSLGNVPAIYLASERIKPRALISEAPFASSSSLTQGSLGLDLPAGWLTEGRFDNADRIKRISTPFMLIHGSADDFVRWRDNGRVIFENAHEPKKLILVEGGNHTDLPDRLGDSLYLASIEQWIR